MGDDFNPDMVAGHSLGEFSALVAAGALSFTVSFRIGTDHEAKLAKTNLCCKKKVCLT